MNTITDMEYQIFRHKKYYSFIVLILLLLPVVKPGFSKPIGKGNVNSFLGYQVKSPKKEHHLRVVYTAPFISFIEYIKPGILNLVLPPPSPPPIPITANADSGFVNGYTGNATLVNIFTNDSFNNIPVSGSSIKVSFSITNSHIRIDTSSGVVSITPGIVAGDYIIAYSICDTSDLSNCASAVLTIHVSAPNIIANSEFASVNGYNGSSNLLNVFTNDSINGLTVTAGAVSASILTVASNPGVSLNVTTGVVSVAANTHAGSYNILYRICDTLNPSNCDTAIVLVSVLQPPIVANADNVSVNSYNGGLNILNIYTNDSLNNSVITTGRVNLTVLSAPANPGLFLNSGTGRVSVFPYTLAGIYTFIYRICDTMNVSNCDTALITVTVLAPPVIANADAGIAGSYNGNSNLLNIFSNDSLNNRGTTVSSVNLSLVTAATNPGIALNLTNGIVSVGVGVPAALYTIIYKICDTLNVTNCDTAIIRINITAPLIRAHADVATVSGYNGNPALLNVLANDSINGSGFNAGRVNLSVITPAGNPRIALNLITGVISVTGIVTAGTYTLQYKICDTLNAGNCDSAIVTVNVFAPPILANSDRGSVNGTGTPNLLNVLSNDSINGTLVHAGGIKITLVTPATFAGIRLDTLTGIVSISTAPTGSYSLIYRICDSANTSNCDTSILFVTITPPVIDATNDTASVDGYSGSANLINVLANDTLGNRTVSAGAVFITVLLPSGNPGIILNTTTGAVSITPRMASGIFTIHYKICDTLNPTNCDTAIIYIRVIPPVIDAVNDTFLVNGYSGSLNSLKVLKNDRIGNDTARLGSVHITVLATSGISGIVLDTTTGVINVLSRLSAATYSIRYRISDTLNAGNTDSATAIVVIVPPPVKATREIANIIGYNNYPSLINILANDSFNNIAATAGSIKISIITPASHVGIKLNDTTGIISVTAPVPPGIYTITYSICDTFYTSNCSTTRDTIIVSSPVIIASNDSSSIIGYNIGFNFLNVLANDSLNASVIIANAVKLKVLIPPLNSGIKLDSTGLVRLIRNVPAGIYFIEYRICDLLDTLNCDTALARIVVNAPQVIAIDDSVLVDSYTGTTATFNVLNNDRVNGIKPMAGNTIKISVLTGSGNPNILLDSNTGFLNVGANTITGNYTITYIISDTLNAGNSDTAILLVKIRTPLVFANADFVSVNGYDGNLNLLNVLANDSFSNFVITTARVNFTLVLAASHPGIILNTGNGRISVFPFTPAGIYYLIYRICDTLNTTSCDTALVIVNVTAPHIVAHNDSGYAAGYAGSTSLLNVFTNDTLNHTVISVSSVKLRVLSGFGNSAIVFDTLTGIVRVRPGIVAGIYTLQYQVCDTLNPGNCSTAIVKVNITSPTIIAINDTGVVSSYTAVPNLLNIFANDSFNRALVIPSSVKLLILVPFGNTHLALDTFTGNVSVAQFAPAGTYSLQYRICDTLNTGNCALATVIVTITAPVVIATNDTGLINGFTGSANLINVLLNDSINGGVADTGSVKLSMLLASGNAGVLLNTITGNVSVSPLTIAGIYTILYKICDAVNTGNCDTARVVINVTAGKLIAIEDTGSVNGYSGKLNLLNVLDNDSINGTTVSVGPFKLQVFMPSANAGVTFDTLTGIIDVMPLTAAGIYSVCYIITDTLNTINTDTACATILVFASGPMANPDSVQTPSATAVVINPLLNDYDVDSNIHIASINITFPALHGTAFADTIMGLITYTPDLGWSGYDTLYYSICDSGMVPVLCDTSFIVIRTTDSINVQNIIISNLKCYGDSTGSAELIIQGGIPPYNITWNTIPVQTGNIAINLKAGTYQATITDSSNKTIVADATVTGPLLPITTNIISSDPKCFGEFNGSISLNVSGGTPPYTTFWNNGSILKSLDKINAGNYDVIITDFNGCILQKGVTLKNPNPLNISAVIVDAICKSTPGGRIAISITGGVMPYTFLWNTGDTTMNLNNISNGQYNITVTDTNTCKLSASYTVNYTKETCDHEVFIPQGFSPDGDGINDVFKIDGIEKFPDNYLRIFNRWGGLVFEEHSYKNTWKGTSESGVVIQQGDQTLPTGTYFYVLDLGSGIKTITGYFYISK
ncbi:MAG: gliding motility-associated C-terminal domain-containing protein [Bacteroidia bacterium]|nr:gliding motility-associated C-terminal domain-containing protein [Bacteroidia bacterium]